MKLNVKVGTRIVLALMAPCLVTITSPDVASAKHHKKADQQPTVDSQTAMEIFPIQRGYDGAEFIVTKAGYLVSIPGLGVAPDATQIAAYRDGQNNIWYIDRNGVPVKLTDQQVQWGMAQINQQAQARAMQGQQPMAPSEVPMQNQQAAPNVVVVQQPVESSGSSGTGALVTGLAAAGGAMAGAALSNSLYHNNYYGVPYGTPLYHNGGRYYYNGANGNKVYVNNSNNKYINQFNQQTNWQNAQRNYQHNNATLPARQPAGGHGNYPGHGNVPGHGNFPTQMPAHGSANGGRNLSGGSVGHHQNLSAGGFGHQAAARAPRGGGGARGGFSGGARGGGGRRR